MISGNGGRSAPQLRLVNAGNIITKGNNMPQDNFVPRGEHDAKLNATEERLSAQVTRVEAKIDTALAEMRADMKVASKEMLSFMETINKKNEATDNLLLEYRQDARATKYTMIGILATTIIGVITIAVGMVAIVATLSGLK